MPLASSRLFLLFLSLLLCSSLFSLTTASSPSSAADDQHDDEFDSNFENEHQADSSSSSSHSSSSSDDSDSSSSSSSSSLTGRIDSSLPLNSPFRLVPFSFYDYLIGEWDIYKSTATYSTNAVEYHPVRGKYLIEKDVVEGHGGAPGSHNSNSPLRLIGRYWDNDTETSEIYNELLISIEFNDNSTGVFSTGHDEDSMKELFSFSFQHHVQGLATSVGEWRGAADSYYLFQVSSTSLFTITVTPKSLSSPSTTSTTSSSSSSSPSLDGDDIDVEDGSRIVIYTGRKVVVETEKTFYQKYGTFLLLGSLFVVNILVKSRTAGSRYSAARGAPAETVSPGVAGRANTHGLKFRKTAAATSEAK